MAIKALTHIQNTAPYPPKTIAEYAFFFATDLSTFYPKDLYDNDDKNLKNDVHEAMFNALVGLQYEIDKHNEGENDYDVKLYIVDTSQAAGSYNLNLLFDPNQQS